MAVVRCWPNSNTTRKKMIISENVSTPISTNILAAPSSFKIKASARAFKILSGFYSEPILAIPRELGANAWDSHVKAGNTATMFEVHAPNNLEPWFSVRDFGTGLSPEDIEPIYTTYFESTKTRENDSDGCMGLGSKTPFNYTDNFNVTSFFDGKKYVYNCYIDERGVPNIMRVVAEDSKEHNGLEVKFGVKMTDINMWVDKIVRAYEPFRFRPIVKGAKIEFPAREYLYQGKNWALRKNEGYHTSRDCNAIMGNYCYPVSHTAIRSALHSAPNLGHLETMFSWGGFDFFFNIGDLEVAPNKEQLQYEDGNSTSKQLIEIAKCALKELKEIIEKSVDVPKTRWEAMSSFNRYNSYNSPYSAVRNIVGDIPVIFNGVKITHGNENVSRVHTVTNLILANTQLPHFQLHLMEKYVGRCKKTGTYYPQADGKEVIVFYTNSDSIKIARLRHYLKATYADNNKPFPMCYVITDASAGNKTFFAHKAYFGWDDSIIKNIESLPKPPPVPRAKKIVNTDEIYYADISRYIDGNSSNPYVSWGKKAQTFETTNTYYYVDFMYSEPVWQTHDIGHVMNEVVKLFVNNKLNDGSKIIYGINRKNVNLLKFGTWINVMDVVNKYVKTNVATFEDHLYIREYKTQLASLNNLHQKVTRGSAFIKSLVNEDTRKLFQSFVSAVATADKLINEQFNDNFYQFFNITAKKHKDVPIDIAEFKKLLKNKYMGIFDMVYEYSENITGLVKVVNFIDEKS